MRGGYTHPYIFRYLQRPNVTPIVTDPSRDDFNADDKVLPLRYYIQYHATYYRTNRLMIPWGGDFAYYFAHDEFKNLQKTIDYFNAKFDDITLLYSTPSEYIDALKQQDVKWPVRYDDMFPYADDEHSYWTGFYTSRPQAKRQDRQT